MNRDYMKEVLEDVRASELPCIATIERAIAQRDALVSTLMDAEKQLAWATLPEKSPAITSSGAAKVHVAGRSVLIAIRAALTACEGGV